jgi:hypothetical protein
MKKIILLVIALFILVGCTNTAFPPKPGAPGGPIGQAVEAQQYYAEPANRFLISESTLALKTQDAKIVNVNVKNQDFVYRYGFIWKDNQWTEFEYTGTTGNKDWLVGDATATQTISLQDFNEGTTWILAYGCAETNTGFDCNGNKWMLQSVAVKQLFPNVPDRPDNSNVVGIDTTEKTETSTESTTTDNTPDCTDSDAKSYTTKGIVTVSETIQQTKGWQPQTSDTCVNVVTTNSYVDISACSGSNCTLREYYCDANGPASEIYACAYGCVDGACNPAPTKKAIGEACSVNEECDSGMCEGTCTQELNIGMDENTLVYE